MFYSYQDNIIVLVVYSFSVSFENNYDKAIYEQEGNNGNARRRN